MEARVRKLMKKYEQMEKEDLRYEEFQTEDAEYLFGKGTMWSDYSTYDAAQKAIDSLSNNEEPELEDND